MISLFPALRVSHLEKKKIIVGQWKQRNDYSPHSSHSHCLKKTSELWGYTSDLHDRHTNYLKFASLIKGKLEGYFVNYLCGPVPRKTS